VQAQSTDPSAFPVPVAGAACLDSLKLPGPAGGLPLVGSRLHLPVLSGPGELVHEVDLVSVGHGFNEHTVAFHAIARDLCELSARALFLFHPRDFALGRSARDLVDRVGVAGLISSSA
jgi:hypothetical protein